jgi:hypothetical protein
LAARPELNIPLSGDFGKKGGWLFGVSGALLCGRILLSQRKQDTRLVEAAAGMWKNIKKNVKTRIPCP